MLIRLFALLLLLPIGACGAQNTPAVEQAASAVERLEGRDYVVVGQPGKLNPADDRIEVVEVFAYTCPHCAHIEPLFVEWKSKQPADVNPLQVPLAFGGPGEAFARLFYAAESMGVLGKTHQATFDALHTERRPFRNMAELLDMYAELGVDRAAMEAALDSFPVNAKLAQAREAVPRWGVEGTPAFVVDGRYRILGGPEGSHAGVIATLDHVVAMVRAERQGN